MIPLCQEEGIGILPWSPLARGFLTKPNVPKTSRRAKSDTYAHTYYGSDSDFKVLDNVQQLALQKSCTPAQIALAWLLHQPNVTAPIIGTTKITHLKEAVQAIDIQLTKEECHFLEQYYLPKIILGHE
jgi:aryl-alcohol dehydrogenase (NADP+)